MYDRHFWGVQIQKACSKSSFIQPYTALLVLITMKTQIYNLHRLNHIGSFFFTVGLFEQHNW